MVHVSVNAERNRKRKREEKNRVHLVTVGVVGTGMVSDLLTCANTVPVMGISKKGLSIYRIIRSCKGIYTLQCVPSR